MGRPNFDEIAVLADVCEFEPHHQRGVFQTRLLRWTPKSRPSADFRKFGFSKSQDCWIPGTGVSVDIDDLYHFRGAVEEAIRASEAMGLLTPKAECPGAAPAPKKTRARVKLEPVAVADADILELHRAGRSGREIAETFGISTPTVSRRLRRALQGEPPEISRATDEISSAPSVTTSEPDSAGGRDQVEFALEPTE